MNTIELINVAKQYHKKERFFSKTDLFWAVQNISFSVKKGETLSLVGSNGAGKTTIMKLIGKITYPTSGRVIIHGKMSIAPHGFIAVIKDSEGNEVGLHSMS